MTEPAPFVSLQTAVQPEWIDFNGHFNAGYYAVVFDDAIGPWLDHLGLSREFRDANEVSTFTVQSHITYVREIAEGEPIEVRSQLLGSSAKAIHSFQTMHHGTEGWLAATNEVMSLHVSMQTRRSAAMADVVQQRLAEVAEQHDLLPQPPQAGALIALR